MYRSRFAMYSLESFSYIIAFYILIAVLLTIIVSAVYNILMAVNNCHYMLY